MSMLRRKAKPDSDAPADPGCTLISELAPRTAVRIRGQVVRMRARPARGLPSLEVVVDDGSGRVIAVWSGRRSIGGVSLGRHLVIEGVAVMTDEGPTFLNPMYELRSSGH